MSQLIFVHHGRSTEKTTPEQRSAVLRVDVDVRVSRCLQLSPQFPLERGETPPETGDVVRRDFQETWSAEGVRRALLKRPSLTDDIGPKLVDAPSSQNGSRPCSMPRPSSCHARMLTTFAAGAVANCAQASINCCLFSKRVVRR